MQPAVLKRDPIRVSRPQGISARTRFDKMQSLWSSPGNSFHMGSRNRGRVTFQRRSNHFAHPNDFASVAVEANARSKTRLKTCEHEVPEMPKRPAKKIASGLPDRRDPNTCAQNPGPARPVRIARALWHCSVSLRIFLILVYRSAVDVTIYPSLHLQRPPMRHWRTDGHAPVAPLTETIRHCLNGGLFHRHTTGVVN